MYMYIYIYIEREMFNHFNSIFFLRNACGSFAENCGYCHFPPAKWLPDAHRADGDEGERKLTGCHLTHRRQRIIGFVQWALIRGPLFRIMFHRCFVHVYLPTLYSELHR